MPRGIFLKLQRWKVGISVYLFLSIFLGLIGDGLIVPFPKSAEAVQVTIDSTALVATSTAGAQTVFIDDLTGYKFFRDAPGYCVYRKTTDGGATWSGTTTVDSQIDCIGIQVWHDKWTPGLTASSGIHIVTMDTGNDDIWYNRIDTDNNDQRLLNDTPTSTNIASGQGGTSLTSGENFTSITRGTDGTLYVLSNDGSGTRDSFVLECTSSCNRGASWTERTGILDDQSDQTIMAPLPTGDIMFVQRDISADDMRYRIWDDTTATSSAWTIIDANASENLQYDIGFSIAVSTATPGNLYMAYTARTAALGTDDQVRAARFNGTSWATTSDPLTSTARKVTGVAIGIDSANDDVYVAYSSQQTVTTTADIHWKWATSSMVNWSSEIGPINTSQDDMHSLDINIADDQRLFVSWLDSTDDDIFGDTLVNLFPGVHVSSTGNQTATTFASSSNLQLGNKFLLYNTYRNRALDVTDITITESGTIDGSVDVSNLRLQYEMDSVYPYDCVSVTYDGSESPFGSTDTNGFSGSDGVSTFSGTTVSISTTTAMCIYTVMDIKDSTLSSSTLEISIANPVTDIVVTQSTAGPTTTVSASGTTLIYNDTASQMHYHWRENDGSEALATSKTAGVQDTPLNAMRQGSTTRLRFAVSNEGSSSTPAFQYRLEYAANPGSCSAAGPWTNVGDLDGDFDMADSLNLTEGADTTNIATSTGGVGDDNPTFLTPNGGVRDTSSQTGDIVLSSTEFVELEYSIVASTTAAEGNSYCFRVTNQGTALPTYNQYARANIASDVLVSVATSSQVASTTIPTADFYVGSGFVITENVSSRQVTSITVTESGSVDGSTGLSNIRLQYDLDATAPYDCADQSYSGGDLSYGTTDTDGFSWANGSSTFTGSVTISTTSTMCMYVVFDVTALAQDAQTIDIVMESPAQYLGVSAGSVSPGLTRDMNGSTTLWGSVLTQTHYHWRADNGSELTATSLSGGVDDTPITFIDQTTPVRLRLQVSNEGTATAPTTTLRIETAPKVTTCSAVSSWTDIGQIGGAWDMYNSPNFDDATNTTNIAEANGGVADENVSFIVSNFGMKDASSTVATSTPTSTQFIEVEFSIRQTSSAGYDTTYCFRVSNAGTALNAYSVYPELTTSPERDFEIQRGTFTMTGTTTTLTAGVDYTAPSASTSAFIRITNIGLTGAGHNTGALAAQLATNTTVYIVSPSNITSSVQFARTGISSSTRVSWEIVEFIGEAGSDNEMIVRSQTFLQFGTASTVATGTAVSGVVNDSKIVVFITGQQNPDTGSANYESGLFTSEWHSSSDRPVFRRGVSGSDAGRVSYAVVEFTGQNWLIQRAQHTYSSAGSTETENITPLNSTSRTFLHVQKRNTTGLAGTDEYGAEVWLSSITQVSFFLQGGATTPSGQTSVAWIIENLQTSEGAMVVTRSSYNTLNGTPPLTQGFAVGKTLSDLSNASIFSYGRSSGTGNTYTQPMAGVTIASSTGYTIWRSNVASTLTFRTEVVEWPTAGLALRQNDYIFYADNNALLPTDPWPPGAGILGENSAITGSDEPLGEGERVRIRMSLQALNASFPEGTRSFKLQYGEYLTSCGAISESNWKTLGSNSSSTIWRGYNATGTTDGTLLSGDPPTLGDLLLTVADVAGTLEEINDTTSNNYAVPENEDIEYDWIVEQNGANAETVYCFRMIESDGTLLGSYSDYPQIRTASFSPRTQNWRFYDDAQNATPTTTLATENTAPIDIEYNNAIKLRITVKEIKNIARDDVRFSLQFSEYSDFTLAYDVTSTSTCIASSTWCYTDGGGTDNAVLSTTTLSDADACTLGVGDGCGTHNESSAVRGGFRHENNAATEYEFSLIPRAPRVNRVYYFRLFDVVQGLPVITNTSETYPSLATEGASLSFSVSGLASTTVLEGVTLDVGTTPNTIEFGTLSFDTSIEAAHRLAIDANATEGYQISMQLDGDIMNYSGAPLRGITSTNTNPLAWSTGCSVSAPSCLGYHTSDATLLNGSTRFAADDTYARFSTTTLEEIGYNSIPVLGETVDVIFRAFVRNSQDAGLYEGRILYVTSPIF